MTATTTATRSRWTNWGRCASAEPAAIAYPRSTAEVADLVRSAAASGQHVKAVGAGHSFTPIAVTDGVLLHLDHIAGVQHVDRATGQVTVGAGMRLHDLNPALHALGLALPNMGDVDPQSMAGATSTGTHGTGARLQGIAGAIVGLEIVTGDGSVVTVTPDDKDLFGAARVGLGALGIVTSLTFACVPSFLLHAREEPMLLPDVVEQLDTLVDDNDHFEFYWFPHTDRALVKRNNRVLEGTERKPLSKARFLLDDEVLSNGLFEVVNRIATHQRRWVPKLNAISGRALSPREYTDWSYEVFVSPRRVRFREMEYAVPRAALPDVLREVESWVNASDETVSRRRTTSGCRRGTTVRTHTWPCTSTTRWTTAVTSRASRRSSPSTRDGRTGASCTRSTPARCGPATRGSSTSSPSATVWTRSVRSATTTWGASSADAPRGDASAPDLLGPRRPDRPRLVAGALHGDLHAQPLAAVGLPQLVGLLRAHRALDRLLAAIPAEGGPRRPRRPRARADPDPLADLRLSGDPRGLLQHEALGSRRRLRDGGRVERRGRPVRVGPACEQPHRLRRGA
jgi:FAD/FMN-containing dehydrogenase